MATKTKIHIVYTCPICENEFYTRKAAAKCIDVCERAAFAKQKQQAGCKHEHIDWLHSVESYGEELSGVCGNCGKRWGAVLAVFLAACDQDASPSTSYSDDDRGDANAAMLAMCAAHDTLKGNSGIAAAIDEYCE